ncbi:hypothetical protein H0E87_004081 [Populus deltoides]|uniref:Uncharacterized protein n=1 Tax=Populus deltoides TaxID=3696 RepID=A0A8T2ZF73_POPDE|nr:hypothetical protein H0E87_004081 [Populus deltoides]
MCWDPQKPCPRVGPRASGQEDRDKRVSGCIVAIAMGLDSDRNPCPHFQVSVSGGLDLVPSVAGSRKSKNLLGGLGKQVQEERFDSSSRLHAEGDAEHTLASRRQIPVPQKTIKLPSMRNFICPAWSRGDEFPTNIKNIS